MAGVTSDPSIPRVSPLALRSPSPLGGRCGAPQAPHVLESKIHAGGPRGFLKAEAALLGASPATPPPMGAALGGPSAPPELRFPHRASVHVECDTSACLTGISALLTRQSWPFCRPQHFPACVTGGEGMPCPFADGDS